MFVNIFKNFLPNISFTKPEVQSENSTRVQLILSKTNQLAKFIFKNPLYSNNNPIKIVIATAKQVNFCLKIVYKKIHNIFHQIVNVNYLDRLNFFKLDDEALVLDNWLRNVHYSNQSIDCSSVIQEILSNIQSQFNSLDASIDHLVFDYKILPQIAQIDYEIEENRILFKELKIKYLDTPIYPTILQSINDLDKQLNELKQKHAIILEEKKEILGVLLDAFPLENEETSLSDWSQCIYQRCLKLYNKEPTASLNKSLLIEAKFSDQALSVSPPTGITNGGNNCYAIASLQALFHHPFFNKQLQHLSLPQAPLQLANETQETYHERLVLHDAYRQKLVSIQIKLKKFQKIFLDPQTSSKDLNTVLIELRNLVFKHGLHPALMHGEEFAQQDAADFAAVILESINYAISIEDKLTPLDDTLNVISKQKTENDQLYRLNIKDPSKNMTLQELIDDNIQEMVIDDPANAWNAETTDHTSIVLNSYKHEKSIVNSEIPSLICLHIVRHGYGQNGPFKISTAFDFEETLDLSSLIPNSNGERVLYRVVSCVNHHGHANNPHSGHYTSYVQKNGQWFDCNDANVKPIDEKIVHQGNGYIYMLEKVENTCTTMQIVAEPEILPT